ncbi:hypothetical protein [Vibrio sp. D431a]|uniref:hypothetical protein n=1 Tax=Vibrio sp. D431a TaxID=2837388 RepID=UPI0025578024|nr:hypothetical protein [Vibrio sp. D431a]MDK9789900.1 hypothetical protein [Vibrio sp. D431a]
MSKRGGGRNRVCFPCRKKYPSQFTTDSKKYNVTSVCSECSGVLSSVPDSVVIPKSHQLGRWKKLKAQYDSGQIVTPACDSNISLRHWNQYPEHLKLDSKLHKTEVRHDVQNRFYSLLKHNESFVRETLACLFKGVQIDTLIDDVEASDKTIAAKWQLRDELYTVNRYFSWYKRDCEKILGI